MQKYNGVPIILSDGIGLDVDDQGSGPNVILIHGYTTTRDFWTSQVAILSKQFRVISFSLRGHGESSKPDSDYTIETFSADLIELMHHLDVRAATLVGLSMGGAIALHTAFKNPDAVKGLVLVDTTAHGLGPDVEASHVLNRMQSVGVHEASGEIIRRSFGPSADPSLIPWAIQEVHKTPRHVAERAILSLGEFDARSWLRNIRCPTLVIVGSEDVITPLSLSAYLAESIPGAELRVIHDAGHFPMLEQPVSFNTVLVDFLSSLDESA